MIRSLLCRALLLLVLCAACSDPSPVAPSSPEDAPDTPNADDSNPVLSPRVEPPITEEPDTARADSDSERRADDFEFCTSSQECEPGLFCIDTGGGGVCGATCESICPEGTGCAPMEGVLVCDTVNETGLETSEEPLCRPCISNADCTVVLPESECKSYGAIGSFCGRPCDEELPCPEGFVCAGSQQCIRVDGPCNCSQSAIEDGASTVCADSTGEESCEGIRWCTETGLSPCTSSAEEQCDGIDNNCDGQADEGLENCSPPLPADEDGDGVARIEGDCDDSNGAVFPGVLDVCDGQDNDCDGMIDEDGSGEACTLSNEFGECVGVSICEFGEPGCSGEPANECGGCGSLPSNYQSPCSCNGTIDCTGECTGGTTLECAPMPCFVGTNGVSGSAGCPDTCSSCFYVPWRTCACSAGFGEPSLTFSAPSIGFGETITVVAWFPEPADSLALRINGTICQEISDFVCDDPADCAGQATGWVDLDVGLFQIGNNKVEILAWVPQLNCEEQSTVVLRGFLPFPP